MFFFYILVVYSSRWKRFSRLFNKKENVKLSRKDGIKYTLTPDPKEESIFEPNPANTEEKCENESTCPADDLAPKYRNYIEIEGCLALEDTDVLSLEIISLPSLEIEEYKVQSVEIKGKLYVEIQYEVLLKLLCKNTSFMISVVKDNKKEFLLKDIYLTDEFDTITASEDENTSCDDVKNFNYQIFKTQRIKSNSYTFYFKYIPLLKDTDYLKKRIDVISNEILSLRKDYEILKQQIDVEEHLEFLQTMQEIVVFLLNNCDTMSYVSIDNSSIHNFEGNKKYIIFVSCSFYSLLKDCKLAFLAYINDFGSERNYLENEFSEEFHMFIRFFRILYFMMPDKSNPSKIELS